MIYKEQAEKYYKGHEKYNKALSAGIMLDNSLRNDYTKDGHSNIHFRIDQYLKYFSYESLKKYNLI